MAPKRAANNARGVAKKARIAEQECEVVAKGVEVITGSAFDGEIGFIVGELRKDIPFACMVASLLREGSLKPLLTMKSNGEEQQTPKSVDKREKVRQAMKNS